MWLEQSRWIEDGAVPARDIHRGRQGRNTIYFPSIKNKRQVICESALEASYCIWLEWDSDVAGYYAQPKTFRWQSDGQTFRYTPDFFVVHRTSADHFTEVKPDFTRTSRQNRATLEAFGRYCEEHGRLFKRADVRTIKQQTRLDNLRLLYNGLHRITRFETDYCLSFLAGQGHACSLKELARSSTAPSLRSLYWAIFCGEVMADLEVPLTLNTVLTKKSVHHERETSLLTSV